MIPRLLLIALLVFMPYSLAAFRSYQAEVDESQWSFSGNPLGCELSHTIPLFGKAKFAKAAGDKQNLQFAIDYKRQPITTPKAAKVVAIAPSWQPQRASQPMGETQLTAGKNIITADSAASWQLLNELESGNFPTFFYQGFNPTTDRISVALSAVGFKAEYQKFLDCMTGIVPHHLEELKNLTLYFDFDQSSVRADYLARLNSLAAYVKYDPAIEVIFISGHTDNKGSRYYNDKLSQSRIDSVKKILSQHQVDESRFKTFAYGERKPAASNRTEKGRAKNRRVYIQIVR